ncbi:MAG: hypothetical protein EZS28_016222, partial [Streblomastix strix]
GIGLSISLFVLNNRPGYSTYSENLKKDSRSNKQVEYPGRLFSTKRDIDSPMPSVGDNTNSGLVRNRGKQTRRQIRGNRRGRGSGGMIQCIFETLE